MATRSGVSGALVTAVVGACSLACGGAPAPDVTIASGVTCGAEHLDVCRVACDGGDGPACTTMVDALLPSNVPFDACKDAASYKYAAEKGCQLGEMRGCQVMGSLLHNGAMGLAQDDAKAVELWTKGCDAGHGRSCLFLARAHEFAWGLKASHAKWSEYAEKACALNELEACSDIAWTLVDQKKPDDTRAAELWKKGCDAGNQVACRGLGWAHETGRGVVKDEAKARALMQKSCDSGVVWACGNLGWYLQEGMGGPQDKAGAKPLLDKACKDGMDFACEKLGGKKKVVEEELFCGEFMTIACGKECVHFHEDENNCGGCGFVCPGGYFCDEGTCTPQ